MPPPETLIRLFHPKDLSIFTEEELARFLAGVDPLLLLRINEDPEAWHTVCQAVAWELLYRLDPGLYERLTTGEELHPGILAWLPNQITTAVEVGAGTGRLTMQIAERCGELIAVEPATPLASRLGVRLQRAGFSRVQVVKGFFDALPVADGWAELVVACSAFTTDPGHGGEAGLAEMERVCADEGLIVVIWPDDPVWMVSRGYETLTFPGQLALRFESLEEAVTLSQIFYPHAVGEILRLKLREVPYETVGMTPPSVLSWKRKAGS